MRILILNHEYPPVGGGAATATREIATRTALRGHSVRVLTGTCRGLPPQEHEDGVEVFRLPMARHSRHESNAAEVVSFSALALPAAVSHFARFRPDVTIAFFGVPAGPIALAGRMMYGVPYIVSLRGADVPGFAGVGPFTNLGIPLITLVWQCASAIVANAPQLRLLAQRTASRIRRRVCYIPNGIDLERFSPARAPGSGQFVRALFVGRLAEQKGPDVLMDALELLDQDLCARIVLTVVGDGPLRARMEARAHRLLPGRAEFQGWQPRERLPGVYAGADLLVLPALMEGMPNVVLEAMAAGLPVVATRVGGCPDLVAEGVNGLLAEPGSADAFARALGTAIGRGKGLANWGTASRRLATGYSWDSVVDRYLALAEAAVVGRARR